ncbi:MAG: sigma-70 family RNA polymerase sigma factor [Myxococcales bacterium]|nr:sigma-70 family RNA polymerase sigma factor [Myxococcales bacterium]MDP3502938.1 sigma-70 family RNA polymerase sigma factor [Myxococcales bacterium]
MSRPAFEVIDGGRSAGRAWLKELYSTYGGAVFQRCRYLLKDSSAAEDAMQDVFARAMSNETSFRGEASPLTWLLKISTNHCLNVLREKRAAWHDQYESMERVKGEAHGGPGSMEARDLVRRSLKAFDPETQLAVIHYWVDDLTLEEVAGLLGRSVPTIRKRLNAFTEATGQAMREGDGGVA